ncbi:MAG: tRNA 2-thiouridine(34) synthase MnmA [Vampirovibrionales bacterium]|nr:tRNA 2-thiouridine(34) synthase MnmA [Vampirovibrionales bacterium]
MLNNIRLNNYLPPKPAKIAVAMSGGVDSSVVAWMLHQQGYQVVGFTAWTLNGPGACCNDALINAGRVCERLGVPYETVDLRDAFTHYVMNHYDASYQAGLTPNPCVECNRFIKWGPLVRFAREQLGADYIATGHYAQRVQHAGRAQIHRAVDGRKDQTYMLARVAPEDFDYALFPLGGMVKTDVVAMAREADIPNAYSKESMDVCFVAEQGQANYLKGVLGESQGLVLDYETGETLGTHSGHYLFTRGQRKGVQVAAGRPVYVIKTDAATNTVWVGDAHHLQQDTFTVKAVNWLETPDATGPGDTISALKAKIRYASPPQQVALIPLAAPGLANEPAYTLKNIGPEPFSGVTPGQIAVFYDDAFSQLLGGGYIEAYLPQQARDFEALSGTQPKQACAKP